MHILRYIWHDIVEQRLVLQVTMVKHEKLVQLHLHSVFAQRLETVHVSENYLCLFACLF